MSREDVIAVASRLFAIFLVVSAIRTIGSAFQVQREVDSVGELVYYTLPVVIPYLLVGAFLWFFPVSVARKLLPVMRDSGQPIAKANSDVAAIAFSVLGMWILAEAISSGIYWVVLLSGLFDQGNSVSLLSVREKASIISIISRAAIGFYLFFGARGIASLLRKFRYGSSA